MRIEPTTDWRRRSTPSEPLAIAISDVPQRQRPTPRQSARAAALTAVAVGIAVFASGCDRSPAAVTGNEITSGAASVSLVAGPRIVEAGPFAIGAEDLAVPGTPTPAAATAPGGDATSEAAADPTANATAAEDERIAEARAQLSSRSGRRADEPGADLTAAQVPDVVAASEKLDNARLRTANDVAGLSASTSLEATPTPQAAPTRVAVKMATAKPVAATPRPAAPKAATASVASLGQSVMSLALQYVGYRYSWGGISPSTGFDCSGFTYYVYARAGRSIPRSLSGQYGTGAWVARSSMQPGDLIFFQNTYGTGLSHAGIYIGGGRFVSSQSERVGVAIASLDSYWSPHYLGARRP